MLSSTVVRIVDFSASHRWLLIVAGILLTVVAAGYDFARFSINTNVQALISQGFTMASAPDRAIECLSAEWNFCCRYGADARKCGHGG